jgi:hypothetical protein
MFDTLDEVTKYYLEDIDNKHEVIYKNFDANTRLNSDLSKAFFSADGFGELAFCWNWKLVINSMPSSFNFLEIGVYKGRTLGLIQLLANQLQKQCQIYGITPLSVQGDKYSMYEDVNYSFEIFSNLNKMGVSIDNINIIKGLSNDTSIINEAKSSGPYDIIFIDGCHDYEVVCQDIENYLPILKTSGYLVMDDASLFIKNPFGQFLGHKDVGEAIKNTIDNRTDLKHLFAVGHNRIWQKI